MNTGNEKWQGAEMSWVQRLSELDRGDCVEEVYLVELTPGHCKPFGAIIVASGLPHNVLRFELLRVVAKIEE